MKLLTFQASRFSWKPFSKTLEDARDPGPEREVSDCVVAFVHAEARDMAEDRRQSVFRQTLKHLKWLANKGALRTLVLHSFTHLGGENADPAWAKAFMNALDERLTHTGYDVRQTPFGHLCEWDLGVCGHSLGRVWKEI